MRETTEITTCGQLPFPVAIFPDRLRNYLSLLELPWHSSPRLAPWRWGCSSTCPGVLSLCHVSPKRSLQTPQRSLRIRAPSSKLGKALMSSRLQRCSLAPIAWSVLYHWPCSSISISPAWGSSRCFSQLKEDCKLASKNDNGSYLVCSRPYCRED